MIGRPRPVGPDGPVLFAQDRPETVCLVLLSGIGDVIHGLPLANDIRLSSPLARIVWVAEPVPAEVLRHHPAVDRVVVYQRRQGLAGLQRLRRDMRDVRADLTLNAQRYLKSAWPTLLSRASRRVGLPPSKTRDGIDLVHTHALAEGPWKHTQDLFLDFRWALGVEREAPAHWGITFSEEERAEQVAFLEPLRGRPRAGLVLNSANPAKDWPAARWTSLAEELELELGYHVLLLGGASAGERACAQAVRGAVRSRPLDCLADDVRRLMWLVDGCDLVVAPDTGPLHVAHALGVPVIGLFGHTNPWRVGPWARFHELVVDRYSEPGERAHPSDYLPKDRRMEAIAVEDVLEKVEVARTLPS